MSRSDRKVSAALVMAGMALALAIVAVVRGGPADACVDADARAQIAALRRALGERDALVARLVRAVGAAQAGAQAGMPPGVPTGAPPGVPSAGTPSPPSPPGDVPPVASRPRYTRFETTNPAVTVTQKDDGTYDIRTTDPALAGTVMEVTAIGPAGEADKMFVRIPQ